MQDSDFDNRIKSALEEYEDATPVALGWEKFQAMQVPVSGVVGTKRWLKTSVVANVVLVGVVAGLGWNFLDLKGRISELETASPAGQHIVNDVETIKPPHQSGTPKGAGGATLPNGHEQLAVVAELGREQKTKQPYTENNTAPFKRASAVPGNPKSEVPNVSGYVSRRSGAQLTGIAGPLQPPAAVFVTGQATGRDVTEKDRKLPNATLPLSTVIALEKTRMGNKVAWEYGGAANYGYSGFGEGLAGTNMGGGLILEAIFHPLLAVETGLTFQQYHYNTKNQTVVLREWEKTNNGPSLEPIEELSVRVQSLEIPLTLKLRLPKTDRSFWFGSVGVVQSMKLTKYQKYKVMRLEVEEDETEYEEVDLNFRNTRVSPLFTGVAAELGFSKRLSQRNAQWQAGVFYKNSFLRNSLEAGKINVAGVKVGIRF